MKSNVFVLQRAVCLVFLCLALSFHTIQAQMRIGQPSGVPDASAALDISGGPYATGSPYKGIAPPKVALTQTSTAAPVKEPVTGLLIYNTTKGGDVTPGYYYWEGNKWVRLSTSSNTGSARVAATGDPIPAYTLNEVHSWAITGTPPNNIMLIEPGREGLFRLDDNAPITQGIDAMVLITASPNEHRYKRVGTDGTINVKWFGAKGDGGSADDTPAIQAAVNYAKSLLTMSDGGSAAYRATVLFPPGYYGIYKPIDVTKINGITLKGSGTRYINATLMGNTYGIMLDFTGSSNSGCENLGFQSLPSVFASTIGVQFALNADAGVGGLNCFVRGCWFNIVDLPSANKGVGSIGILNCRAEEFAVTDCLIQANVGCLFTCRNTLTDADPAYQLTITSPYATVATGPGSMGVVNFSGQNSILNWGKGQPALVLNGTNSVNFHGYLARTSVTGNATNDVAILATYSTRNFQFNGTIESFSQLLRIKGEFSNSSIKGVVANQINPTLPVIDIQPYSIVNNPQFSVVFGNNQAEIGSRYLIYTEPPAYSAGNTPPVTSQINGGEINCAQFTDNTRVVNAGLLKQCNNVSFNVAKPFEKIGATVRSLKDYVKDMGRLSSPQSVTVATFSTTELAGTYGNGGDYQITIRGKIRAGWIGSGGGCAAAFQSTIIVNQTYMGAKDAPSSLTTILAKSTTGTSYLDINSIAATVKFSNGYGYVVLTPTVSGSWTTEPIKFIGQIEVASDFQVNQSVIID